MRISQHLHHAYKLQDYDFVIELFRQLLNREPNQEEIDYHLDLLASEMSRNDMIIGMLNCEESIQLYSQPPNEEEYPTAAGKIRYLLDLNYEDFVYQLYIELLCRDPDPEGYDGHLSTLREGNDHMLVMHNFLTSEEWINLMESDRNTISRQILAHFLSSL